eukprot:snap_masked-scaffold_8-processed-gene-8.35-mRNA-1 protein AED:1.00 eAED:1.00 QI:0/0/0/0/1/1/2/0/163
MSTKEQIYKAKRSVLKTSLHGLFLAGLSGIPYTFAVLREHGAKWGKEQPSVSDLRLAKQIPGTERSWRMAHLEALLNSMLSLCISGNLGIAEAKLTEKELRSFTFAVKLLVYGNSFASIIGAWTGKRGLTTTGSNINKAVAALFLAAIYGFFRVSCSIGALEA